WNDPRTVVARLRLRPARGPHCRQPGARRAPAGPGGPSCAQYTNTSAQFSSNPHLRVIHGRAPHVRFLPAAGTKPPEASRGRGIMNLTAKRVVLGCVCAGALTA